MRFIVEVQLGPAEAQKLEEYGGNPLAAFRTLGTRRFPERIWLSSGYDLTEPFLVGLSHEAATAAKVTSAAAAVDWVKSKLATYLWSSRLPVS